MKHLPILLVASLLLACNKNPSKDQGQLVPEWSPDGKYLVIRRNGVQLALFRDSSNTCVVELFGPDGLADGSVAYYEDDSKSGVSERKNIILLWRLKDGTTKAVAYDNDGNIVPTNQEPKSE